MGKIPKMTKNHDVSDTLLPLAPLDAKYSPDPVLSQDFSTWNRVGQSDEGGLRGGDYKLLYATLMSLREEFHRVGRFDDANEKLDELCKVLVLKVLDGRHPANGVSRLSLGYLSAVAQKNYGDPSRLAAALHDVFGEMSNLFSLEIDSFGPRAELNLRDDDNDFVRALLPLLAKVPTGTDPEARWEFDTINEAFGHFVQDSFRNRKEDAQYMTPPEVVSAMVDIALVDVLLDRQINRQDDKIVVADPTCGVGSFLAAAYRHASLVDTQRGSLSDQLTLIGQDKVDRMVRLANVNLRVFARANAQIRVGNSIFPADSLDDLTGRVDVVLTNPPFGATFRTDEVLQLSNSERFPVLFDLLRAKKLPSNIDSEYLLLDRELALLKPGGRLLMVVPDHLVSAGGFSETFRLTIARYADLISVIDLPSETFAQAGTRTKTSVVHLRRRLALGKNTSRKHVFMATSEKLGFNVVSRGGASIKRVIGRPDLLQIVSAYENFQKQSDPSDDIVCLEKDPSIALVARNRMLNNRWTAGFYRTERLVALEFLERLTGQGFEGVLLPELFEIDPEESERVFADEINRCISVLHLDENGLIDLSGVDGYRPVTACVRCKTGDILLSTINPRIMRIGIVPPAPWGLSCSSEFAVLRPRSKNLSSTQLMLLLRSNVVQAQIRTLTSGTSSSHNRIKSRDLRSVVVPVPTKGTSQVVTLANIARRYDRAHREYYSAVRMLSECYEAASSLVASLGSESTSSTVSHTPEFSNSGL